MGGEKVGLANNLGNDEGERDWVESKISCCYSSCNVSWFAIERSTTRIKPPNDQHPDTTTLPTTFS